ncbi:BrnT family toxin [Pseudomonas sp. SDO528_S397]
MRFEWDESKNQANIRKHGIDFHDVSDIFQHPMLSQRDERANYQEDRWVSIGWIKRLIGVVVYTERHGDVIRIISARKATKQEAKYYVQTIEN